VSAPGEHSSLLPQVSLYEHAKRLLQHTPDGPLPNGGLPYPGDRGDCPRPPRIPRKEQKANLAALLKGFFADPGRSVEDFQAQLATLYCSEDIFGFIAEPADSSDQESLRKLGLTLLGTSTNSSGVWLALGLLARCGRASDAILIRTVGILRSFARAAATALAAIEGTTSDLIWLAERTSPARRSTAIEAICGRDEPQARNWLLRCSLESIGGSFGGSRALEIARAIGLDALLNQPTVEAHVVDQAISLLVIMGKPNDYRDAIRQYPEARKAYKSVVHHAQTLPPSVERHAGLLSLLIELNSGSVCLLDWAPTEREETRDRLASLLKREQWAASVTAAVSSPDPAQRHRVQWIERTCQQNGSTGDPLLPAQPGETARLTIAVTVLDPAVLPVSVETRILVNGRPVIAEAFDRGPALGPTALLERGQLRATETPREVMLAEAWCTEGCCGALRVTIARDGESVLWRNWQRPAGPASLPPLPDLEDLRFDAAQYDREIARAESDFSWEWPARTTARLLRTAVRERPDLLARWTCKPGWISTHYEQSDHVEFSFT